MNASPDALTAVCAALGIARPGTAEEILVQLPTPAPAGSQPPLPQGVHALPGEDPVTATPPETPIRRLVSATAAYAYPPLATSRFAPFLHTTMCGRGCIHARLAPTDVAAYAAAFRAFDAALAAGSVVRPTAVVSQGRPLTPAECALVIVQETRTRMEPVVIDAACAWLDGAEISANARRAAGAGPRVLDQLAVVADAGAAVPAVPPRALSWKESREVGSAVVQALRARAAARS
jgi:hypothetical protein